MPFTPTLNKDKEISLKGVLLTARPNIPIPKFLYLQAAVRILHQADLSRSSSTFTSLRKMEFEEPKPDTFTNHTDPSSASAGKEEEDDDDLPVLSLHALAALKEFIAEQTSAVSEATVETEEDPEVSLVSEDWRLSQFWYDRETAETVAREVLSLCADSDARVACIACPTLFAYLKRIGPNASVQLLEYDKRFERYGNDFTFYDYNCPEELPSEMKHAFQIVVADPPYLSKECLEKVTKTISFLAKQGESYTLLLTGDVQRDRAAELLGLRPCGFRPQHSSKLGNEFRLFTNYDPGSRLGGWEIEE